MRRVVFLTVVMFLAPAWIGIVSADTPDEITLDGDMSDWDAAGAYLSLIHI